MKKTAWMVCATVAATTFSAGSKAGDLVNYVCQGGTQFVVDYASDGKTALIVVDKGRQGLANTALSAQPVESGMLFTGQPPIVVNDPRFHTNQFSAIQLEFSLVKLTGSSRNKIGVRQGRRYFECESSGPSR
jgi:hypothetical protein